MIMTCLELAVICLLPEYQPYPPPPITDYPALMVIYDPSKGGINCDGDCTTVSIGPLTEDMYYTSGACHVDLLGATIHFPAINFSMRCVDTGGGIKVDYNEYYDRDVLYFDAMWDANTPPVWLYWLLDNWSVEWE